MSLRRKIIIYVGMTTLCMLSLLYFISERALLRNYEQMELESLRENMKQSLLSYFDEYTNLGAIAINYAGWDDTYNFIDRPTIPTATDPYLTVNYTDSLFMSSRLNITLLMNNQKQVYFGKAYDYGNSHPLSYPSTFIHTLQTKYASFLEQSDASSRKMGLLMVDKQPLIATSYPILTSNNEGPVHGTLVFARFLDSNYVQYISEKTDMPLSISIVDPSFTPPAQASTVNVSRNAVPFWTVSDKTTITGFSLLSDVNNKPAVLLKFVKSRELYKEAQRSVLFYLFYFGLSGLIFFFIISCVLQRTIFARLNQTINGMNVIKTKQDFSIRIQETGKDEITQLVKSFNHMMTSLEQSQNEIQYQANHDNLTGLNNRKAFFEYLEKIITQNDQLPFRFAVIFIDLDRFKLINDTMGHHTGDLLLIEVAGRLGLCMKDDEFLCRLGGDEFCIVSHYEHDFNQIEYLAKVIKEAINVTYDLGGYRATISASIGISLYPDHGKDSESLLHHSDVAMLDVKESGKNNYRLYSESIEAIRTRRMLLEQYLKCAIDNDELTLHYQPKLDLALNKIVGVEALLRWTNRQLGHVSPYEFIPIAECSGIINEIGEWIMRSACQQFNAWRKQTADLSLIVAINISGVQLLQPNFLDRIRRLFAEEEVDPCHFELEVTESFAIENFEEVINILIELRNLGFMISIDDFGAGYSSMKYVCQLPIQCMKLDKTLIDQLADNIRSQVVVSSLIEMAHRLQLTVVAEGVELPEQFRILQTYRCDQIQGFLISKPVPAGRIIEMLNSSDLFQVPETK
ncbi:EAL domain-containing protein [Paenibacillus alginolyticus]|uniref:EAL domain-containing protein n=1 Tax=Paenibacillus alginolyticus TaxID=59839 RepID=A0ABT4G673_9BACL|nr:EAL domain-containing protein [Paenibacillus alginolyticus]MCY9691669.1 EAL domain-containing protein [Paenibacillus alginolyticus]MEC0146895.1 EAL domain-containing protein [Paenibacillus alginolyticus]